MLIAAHILSIVGMIGLPIALWIYFTRKFSLSWKLVLAGGLTFIGSQIPHLPLVLALGPVFKGLALLVNAIILGLLAGIFEETARYILFQWILKKSRSWQEGVLVGLGHGGTEAVLIGIAAAATLIAMIGYRNIDLSTVPGISPDQLEVAKQQVAAYWSVPWYIALLGFVERVSTICMHTSWSVMVLYAVTYRKPIWYWLALLAHALVDAIAVYIGPKAGALGTEGILAIFALISLWIIFKMRSEFLEDVTNLPEQQVATG
jgi:uncharacterized membrane protein YhfC